MPERRLPVDDLITPLLVAVAVQPVLVVGCVLVLGYTNPLRGESDAVASVIMAERAARMSIIISPLRRAAARPDVRSGQDSRVLPPQ
jgi:hypothetical protein